MRRLLKREEWGLVRGVYNLDHFRPQARNPKAALDYGNLLYACISCNSAKRDLPVPNPCDCMLDGQVLVQDDGRIEAATPDAKKLILLLGLDDPEYREFRCLWIGIVDMAAKSKPRLFQRLMRYPNNLPDLSRLRPPGNSRPKGIQGSYRVRRDKGKLPSTY